MTEAECKIVFNIENSFSGDVLIRCGTTVAEFLQSQRVPVENAAVSLNGQLIYNYDLPLHDGHRLSVAPKRVNAGLASNEGPWPCKAGSAKEEFLYIGPDFDAPLEEFEEYMS